MNAQMTARQMLIQAATEAGDLDYAAYVKADTRMDRRTLLVRLAYYGYGSM